MDMRRERIERLLRELEYEITRGVMEREIEPQMGFAKILPIGPTGFLMIRMDVRPTDGHSFIPEDRPPRLRVVGEDGN